MKLLFRVKTTIMTSTTWRTHGCKSNWETSMITSLSLSGQTSKCLSTRTLRSASRWRLSKRVILTKQARAESRSLSTVLQTGGGSSWSARKAPSRSRDNLIEKRHQDTRYDLVLRIQFLSLLLFFVILFLGCFRQIRFSIKVVSTSWRGSINEGGLAEKRGHAQHYFKLYLVFHFQHFKV